MEGELAGAALKAQKKALRTTSLSLTLAFLGFMLMQCFFTLAGISTDHTYFERYQNVWDVMVTVKDTAIEDFRIPEGRYARFIVRGDMVKAVAAAWQEIWQMDLPRSFVCDFEEYQDDQMEDTEIHIYVGLKD